MTVRVPTTGNPLVRELFETINRERAQLKVLCRRAGVSSPTVLRWRTGKRVFLDSFEAVLNAMDLELMILPKAKAFTED
jgi:hypothetical protein